MPLHPQATLFLKQMAATGLPPWSEMPVDAARNAFRGMKSAYGPMEPVERVEDLNHDNGFGMRLYHPAPGSSRPVTIYFHGGGWVLGDRDTHDSLCRHLANGSDCAVVSVDYRRAPEHKFPTALNDGHDALQHVIARAEDLELDADKIALAGDSAGGNLAAALCVRTRDDDGPAIRAQLLIYPVIDRRCDTASYAEYAEGFGLTGANMQWFWDQYVAAEDATHPLASLNHIERLDGLPRAHVITAECDVLRDEGEAYAQRLQAAGVPTTVRRYDGMLHGFVQLATYFDHGTDARDDAARFLFEALSQ